MKLFVLIATFIFSKSLLADGQYSNLPLRNIQCHSGQLKLNIEHQKISHKYSVHLLRFKNKDKEITLTSLANVLTKKCLFYFYSYNPEADLFELRLKLSNKKLKGKLILSGDTSLNKEIACQLTEKQISLLPSACFPGRAKVVKKKRKINRVLQKEDPNDVKNDDNSGNISKGLD